MKPTSSATATVITAVACTVACTILLAVLPVQPLAAQTPAPGTVQRPRDAGSGTVLIPDRFLRSWDPVTIFFDRDVGAEAGKPEDQPERYLRMTPEHPGAFSWIDARTLQFRPADPWTPLQRFSWQLVDGPSFSLATLMSPPVKTIPADGAGGLEPVQSITLVFPEPLELQVLARMVTIELRPLPGLDKEQVRWLTDEDFSDSIKSVERASRSDNATYVINLPSPIPLGTRAIVHLRLSLDDDSSRSFTELSFATAEPFRVVSVGSRSTRFPVTPEGSRYTADQAINGGSENRAVVVELSAPPQTIDPVQARNLVRFTPTVDNLRFATSGRTLEVTGDFRWDTLYRVTIAASPIDDAAGRRLDIRGPSEVYLFFPRRPSYLRFTAGQGIVERLGPQMVPIEGRGHDRFDLRIYPLDPLDRSFWPFPDSPVSVDESQRPPGPGETPEPYTGLRHINTQQLTSHLTALGSPAVSSMVELPLRKEGSSASFGLELAPHLQRLRPTGQPGHYLVGLRPLDASSSRQWMRIQVTDLSLTSAEHGGTTRLSVTSLATAAPVPGAVISIEGVQHNEDSRWVELARGTTNQEGAWDLSTLCCDDCSVQRIIVSKGDDVLVLDATRPPDAYHDNAWTANRNTWLQCHTASQPGTEVSHIFTERPVYRPDEPVYIKGYVRHRAAGRLSPLGLSKTFVVVQGPGDLVWRYPVSLSELGSFHHKFHEEELPTGSFSAHLEGRLNNHTWSSRSVSFKLEAYRIPRFEVNLHGPDTAPLDRELEVTLTATYYAGGRVADRPIQWRVTQFPYTWTPETRKGYLFSSDARYSRSQRFEATAAVDREDRTDEQGSAVLSLNPALEPTAQPRTYVVEATVVGADDQTVTATRRVVALPPFILGLKVPRYLEKATAVEPELIVVGHDGELLAGQEVTVRLLHRQWHSYLRASDFSDGEARYVTDVVDEPVSETTITSSAEPVSISLPIAAAGVYVVELEARDRVGRSQTVAVDLYAGGDEPVTWSKPISRVFTVETDKAGYNPGETATFILESPFQEATVLAIVEAPEGNRYRWLPVHRGAATFQLEVLRTWVPRMPVHFVLMRGRIRDSKPIPGSTTDLGKPATLANTTWLKVEPRDNRIEVSLDYPEKALPGKEIEVTIKLETPDGEPLPGEVTLWLVDQAVLALGKEQRLDPLPDMITNVDTYLRLRDTRQLPFGFLPFAENPGGEEAEQKTGILDKATVRRNFQPVPFYDPAIIVGAEGKRSVTVQLPDNLTNFKLRAKAVSGMERFGFATGHLAVRLPVIVQPALPRFVRPSDRFTAAAIGRVVEGEGGPGAAEVAVEGVTLDGDARQELSWVPNQPRRIEFPVRVPSPQYNPEGRITTTEAVFRVGVARLSDGAMDAFEVKLPIRDDRRPMVRRLLADLEPGTPVELPLVESETRPGTVRRSVLISSQPALVRMAAGLSFLLHYPYGCTEQRMSRARAYLAMQRFRDLLSMESSEADYKRAVEDVLSWLPQVLDNSSNLIAYWPGSRGSVSLTAWSLQLLCEARDAGFAIDNDLFETLIRSLEQAMRSDYSHFIDGASFSERCWALTALTRAGRFNPSYAAELARQANYLDLEATGQVLQSLVAAGGSPDSTIASLTDKLWNGVVIRLWQSREIYGGLQDLDTRPSGLILPSETRTVSEVLRAVALSDRDNPRVQVLINGLVTLGRGDGWGSTNANAAALLALSEVLQAPSPSSPERRVRLSIDGSDETLTLGPDSPLVHRLRTEPGGGSVELLGTPAGGPPTVVRAETRWVPAADGSTVAAEAKGFVVSRELQHILGDGAPPRRLGIDEPASTFSFAVGDIVEDHVQVVNPADRYYVAVVVPLAAGMEPLNPSLATAPPEASPDGALTLTPTYAAYLDDQVAFYYNSLPKGTYDFYFRTRATVPGRFIQPSALAEMMYDEAVRGNGNGAVIEIVPAKEDQDD